MSCSHAGGSHFSGRGHLATSHTCVWTVGIAHSETFIRAQDGLQGSSLLLFCHADGLKRPNHWSARKLGGRIWNDHWLTEGLRDPLCFSILVWPGIGEGHLPNSWWHSLQEPPRMADHREFTSLEFGPRSVGSGGLLGQRIKRWARLSRAQIQNTSLTRLRYRNRILIH